MLLPDRSRLLDDPVHQQRWTAHIDAHRKLAVNRPWVKIIDLTDSTTTKDCGMAFTSAKPAL